MPIVKDGQVVYGPGESQVSQDPEIAKRQAELDAIKRRAEQEMASVQIGPTDAQKRKNEQLDAIARRRGEQAGEVKRTNQNVGVTTYTEGNDPTVFKKYEPTPIAPMITPEVRESAVNTQVPSSEAAGPSYNEAGGRVPSWMTNAESDLSGKKVTSLDDASPGETVYLTKESHGLPPGNYTISMETVGAGGKGTGAITGEKRDTYYATDAKGNKTNYKTDNKKAADEWTIWNNPLNPLSWFN